MVGIFGSNLLSVSSVSSFLPRLEMSEENPGTVFYQKISSVVIAEIIRIT